MKQDPFGNLMDWGPALDLLGDLAERGQLADCQSGLTRILKYKGNWRLREEVLKQVDQIEHPTPELILQVLSILGDDNIYYDARILAGTALIALLRNTRDGFRQEMQRAVRGVVERLVQTPQPPYLQQTLHTIGAAIGLAAAAPATATTDRIAKQGAA